MSLDDLRVNKLHRQLRPGWHPIRRNIHSIDHLLLLGQDVLQERESTLLEAR